MSFFTYPLSEKDNDDREWPMTNGLGPSLHFVTEVMFGGASSATVTGGVLSAAAWLLP